MIAIAAMSRNRVIGKDGGIPWRIAEEHRWFRRTTMHGVLIMGRRTFESLSGPLDGRVNVVLTRSPAEYLERARREGRLAGAVVAPAAAAAPGLVQLTLPGPGGGTEVRLAPSLESLEQAGLGGAQAWLCGGAQIYARYLPRCSELYLTIVDRDVDGDAFFPPFEHLFEPLGTLHEGAGFRVLRYQRNATPAGDGEPQEVPP